nr:hypothetical protein GCM10020185_48470 [Pseudomonas brassicacearum subsp. brassicacearum]
MIFGEVTTGLRIEQFNAKFQPPGQHDDFQWCQFQHAQLGGDPQPSQLRHDQPFTVGIEKNTRSMERLARY